MSTHAARAPLLLAPALFIAVAVPFGLITGLFAWAPQTEGLLQVALIALIVPTLLEEVIFRGPLLLLPKKWPVLPTAAGLLILFVLWHPLNGLFLMTEARTLFTDPRFLFIAFGLGLTCTFLTLQARNLLPAILFHWLVVIAWKGLLGGPVFFGSSL